MVVGGGGFQLGNAVTTTTMTQEEKGELDSFLACHRTASLQESEGQHALQKSADSKTLNESDSSKYTVCYCFLVLRRIGEHKFQELSKAFLFIYLVAVVLFKDSTKIRKEQPKEVEKKKKKNTHPIFTWRKHCAYFK